MKIPRRSIMVELPQAIHDVSQMQMQGTVRLSHKVGYALGKNLSKGAQVQNEFKKYREEEIKKYYEVDEKGNPVFVEVNGQNGAQKQHKFTPEKLEAWNKLIASHMDEEIEVDLHKISLSELEKVENLPPTFISIIDSLGIISELKLV